MKKENHEVNPKAMGETEKYEKKPTQIRGQSTHANEPTRTHFPEPSYAYAQNQLDSQPKQEVLQYLVM